MDPKFSVGERVFFENSNIKGTVLGSKIISGEKKTIMCEVCWQNDFSYVPEERLRSAGEKAMDSDLIKLVLVVRRAKELLDFVKSKYPDDFKEGGRGFTCPYHIALNQAVKDIGI